MNKKEEKWRMEGASYALRIVREKGIDGLEQDLKMRGALNIPLTVKSKDLEEMYYQLARRIMNSIKTVAMWTLYEQGWRKTRLKRFEEQMDKHSAMCLEIDRYGNSYVTLLDMAKEMNETCGVCATMDSLEQVEKLNREATGRYVALDAILETLEDVGLPEAAELLKEKVNENAR